MLGRREDPPPVLKALYLSMRKIIVSISLVLTCIGVATVIAKPFTCTKDASEIRVISDISSLNAAIAYFKLQNNSYPSNLNELVGTYLEKPIDKDPWGNEYEYISDSTRYVLISYGNPEELKPVVYVHKKKI